MFKYVLLYISLLLSPAFNVNTVGDSSAILSEIKGKTDFRLMLPTNNEWKVIVKHPYPLDYSKTITMVRLHYFDGNDSYVIGVEQHRANGYKITREKMVIDVKNKEERITKIKEYFIPSQSGELIILNGIEARFEAWASTDKGGILRWVDGGTYFEMDSLRLTKNEMIDLAKSMK
ncbi:DUF4367 domain-containing protein [Paenibacillus doosanensis]|uniref:DUF4367 domain-containing protein n=1 Tax=Paenibacillus doosanensis TaxID=1229154 RepID=UPI00217FAC42|nr:DUF4367 domain-containing protein [Paenibacillus doosanensis]MCS7464939.1 DUF4367 domain-containing protein [Paenibacillus doosanensis]